jgi:CBS domain-containing protein
MTHSTPPPAPRLVLAAQRAADLMSPNPVSLEADATVQEAVALMTDRGFSAAPVIDEAGHPVGVLSRTDILVHEREQVRHAMLADESAWETPQRRAREGYSVEVVDATRVADIMTPAVFTVGLDTPAAEVVQQMLGLKVHQMFVVDPDQSLVGVITALDVLRHLQPMS